MHRQRVRRLTRAYLRDTLVLIRQFRLTLVLFTLLLLAGTLILHAAYDPARPLTWGRAIYMTFQLMFFETVGEYPDHSLPAQLVYLLWPVLGIGLAVNGVVRFGAALFNRQHRKEAWQVAVASTYHDHVIVCGLGKLGYRVALQLLRMEQEVVGIEQDPDAPFLDDLHREGVTVLVGNGRDRDVLVKAGVERASAIAVCTQDDLTNLEVSLHARELNPSIKVVMRMFDQQLAERVRQGFGIRTAFSTSALAAPAFAAAATRAAVEHSLYVDDLLFNISRLTIAQESLLAGREIGAVEKELDLTIVCHQGPEGVDYHPPPDTNLAAGDQIVVFATLEALARLNRLNETKREEQRPRRWLGRRKRRS